MYIWYPGKPPECTPELLQHLTSALESFDSLVAHKDGTYLGNIALSFREMYALVRAEQDACLDTDLALRDLRTFCEQVPVAAGITYESADWQALFDLAVGVTDVHQSLEIDYAHTCPTPEVVAAAH